MLLQLWFGLLLLSAVGLVHSVVEGCPYPFPAARVGCNETSFEGDGGLVTLGSRCFLPCPPGAESCVEDDLLTCSQAQQIGQVQQSQQLQQAPCNCPGCTGPHSMQEPPGIKILEYQCPTNT